MFCFGEYLPFEPTDCQTHGRNNDMGLAYWLKVPCSVLLSVFVFAPLFSPEGDCQALRPGSWRG